eukprot:7302326-Alexandrium_andersonii.AAC.1
MLGTLSGTFGALSSAFGSLSVRSRALSGGRKCQKASGKGAKTHESARKCPKHFRAVSEAPGAAL